MNALVNANYTIISIIHLLNESGGLLIDAHIVEADSENSARKTEISVDFSGPDAMLLMHNNGELLKAVHYFVGSALRLELEDLDRIWFDVKNIMADQSAEFQRLVDIAILRVRETSRPYAFAPMLACERHMLHQVIRPSGLKSVSIGSGSDRCVVLYPRDSSHAEQPNSSQSDADRCHNCNAA